MDETIVSSTREGRDGEGVVMELESCRRVIVPVDGSENALRALTFAASVARMATLELHLVHVPPLGPMEMMEVMGYPMVTRRQAEATAAEFDRLREEGSARVFAAARERLAADMNVIEAAVPGDPGQAIVVYAERQAPAMIVMGNRGLSNMQGLVMGSVSDKVLRQAACPVTIVR